MKILELTDYEYNILIDLQEMCQRLQSFVKKYQDKEIFNSEKEHERLKELYKRSKIELEYFNTNSPTLKILFELTDPSLINLC